MRLSKFAKFTWFVLLFNQMVILWGAFVRATGSGAGCGSHWPLCNGEVVPRAPQIDTLIEFTHRFTSGVAFLLVLGMLIWAFRIFPKEHQIRKVSGWAMVFMISESLVGAGLVLFEWVAGNISVARVVVMGIHLLNTHLLLASIVLTAWWSSGGSPIQLKGQQTKVLWLLGIGILGILVLSMAGAITALGDTLFPADSLAEGLQQDFSPTSNFLVRLRFWHPVIATIVGMYIFYAAGPISNSRGTKNSLRFVWALRILFGIQLAAGMINLLLLAPVWMQIVHLFLADLVWIALVLLAAVTLEQPDLQSSV